ncbi:MAG TPA: putative zinc-binding protein [Candidatus Gastranaerophilaceae bacterium]|nr:putative zinc-binding protein [Candidatus Gastranaerophilaceae bacterium]HPT41986.1 putative zinc-binding protein [Candidatus Gastranaerophilaceae bacterium]
MNKKYAILPCNGLDKSAGCVAREIALQIAEQTGSEIICPVLYQVADARYKKITQDNPLLVIDGCQTRCASKLAADKGLKVTKKITVTEYAKNNGIELCEPLRIDDAAINLAKTLTKDALKETSSAENKGETFAMPEDIQYSTYQKDKFIFKTPTEGFLFNENDCWAYVIGNVARVGVADYVQHSLSDIIFFTPPNVGNEVEQFEELGQIESGKAVFEVISPVSGKIIRVNEALINAPELINQDPYVKGWIADIELSNFEEDKEFLLDYEGYFSVLKRKVDEYHVKK